jgi:acetyl esterase/lipase
MRACGWKTRCGAGLVLALLATQSIAGPGRGGWTEEVRLWPGAAPGTETWTGPEVERVDEGPSGNVQIKTNVTVPTLTVFRPDPWEANGTAMLVLPGGAFAALAWDIEGTEVARWLTRRGITAFVLKYRVRPFQTDSGEPPTDIGEIFRLLEVHRKIAVMDANQSVRLLRERADDYGIEPDRIGMIGFSAGGIATIGVLLEGEASARPNFAVPAYALMLIDKPAPPNAPPLFIVGAQDDPLAGDGPKLYNLWTQSQRPAELHMYAQGSHGFGMRPKDLPVDQWPCALESWLDSLGMLTKAEPSGKQKISRHENRPKHSSCRQRWDDEH